MRAHMFIIASKNLHEQLLIFESILEQNEQNDDSNNKYNEVPSLHYIEVGFFFGGKEFYA